jgi:hypothetical protein
MIIEDPDGNELFFPYPNDADKKPARSTEVT